MSQTKEAVFSPIEYGRHDLLALKTYLGGGVALSKIAAFYQDGAPQLAYGLEKWLTEMRADLIERAIAVNPAATAGLAMARKGGTISSKTLELIYQLADCRPAPAKNTDLIGQWLMPKSYAVIATHFKEVFKIERPTLLDLIELINSRGFNWYSPIARLGKYKAQSIVSWLRKQPNLNKIDRFALLPEKKALQALGQTEITLLSPDRPTLLPLEKVTLNNQFDGSMGLNRADKFPFIEARTDLEAINAYLLMHQGREHTQRAYQKELERFLLFCILKAKKPLSSILVGDCEAYKDFLANPDLTWCGDKKGRFSKLWKPFTTKPLSLNSQAYAIDRLRKFFDWLVKVRYLAGNPWYAVKNPDTVTAENAIAIEKSLDKELWEKLIFNLSHASKTEPMMRTSLAIILLLGDTGMRRSELASALREKLKKSVIDGKAWELKVIGKRKKERTVVLGTRAIEALKAHWEGFGGDFIKASDGFLVRPLEQPAINKRSTSLGYTSDGINKVIKRTLKQLVQKDLPYPFSQEEIAQLRDISAHGFRHTFGNLTAGNGMPLDIIQKLLGHASAATTAIYTQEQKNRSVLEAVKFLENQGSALL